MSDRKTEEPQTAMLLTDQEWEDLSVICLHYSLGERYPDETDSVRRLDLSKRIVEAVGR